MRKYTELVEKLNDFDYWHGAIQRLLNKGKITLKESDAMEVEFLISYTEIVEQLLNGTYSWSIPRRLELKKPGSTKRRVVYLYEMKDRVVLSVLYQVCNVVYADRISSRCFSYKSGVCTSDAIKFIRDYKSGEDTPYGVKVDIHSYFNSVSRSRVIQMLDELFPYEQFSEFNTSMESLLLDTRCYWKGKIIDEDKGLVAGTAFASFLANYCLNELDSYIESQSDVVYARYSDDILVLGKSKERIQEILDRILELIEKYGLTINPDKYTWFDAGDSVEYLGLKLSEDAKGRKQIDISNHAKQKIKNNIHRWTRKGRIKIEKGESTFEKEARNVLRRLNGKNFKCYIRNEATFGWCHYAFRYITTIETLKELDFYTRDSLRAMKTGKHNKANVRALNDEDFKKLGWVSLVDLFMLYREDFDYYCEIIELV